MIFFGEDALRLRNDEAMSCGNRSGDARQAQLISNSSRKNDRMDAQMLARLVRVDPRLLRSVQHRSEQAQEHLRVIRCAQPAGLQNWLWPLLEEVESLTQKIQALDQQVEQIARTDYPGTSLLRQVSGVGPLIALTFVLTVEDRERFQKSRDVGCYVGLRSRQSDSGESEPQLRITKEGDPCLRKLLDSNTHKEAQICPVLDDEEIRQASERREVEGDQPRGGWRTQAGSMVRRFAGAFESRRCVKSITNSVARLCRRGA